MSNLIKDIFNKRPIGLGILVVLIVILIVYNYKYHVYYNITLPAKKEKIKELSGSSDDVETIYKRYKDSYLKKEREFDNAHRTCYTSYTRYGPRQNCYVANKDKFILELSEPEKIIHEIDKKSDSRLGTNLFFGIWIFFQGIYVISPDTLMFILMIFTSPFGYY